MIIRCASRRACFRALSRCCAYVGRWHAIPQQNRRWPSRILLDGIRPYSIQTNEFPVLQHLQYPDSNSVNDPSAWSKLLEAGLPPRLRLSADISGDAQLDAAEVGQLLIAAQRPHTGSDEGIDLLFYLGFNQDRWDAVVWIVKRLVERFGGKGLHSVRKPEFSFLWQSDTLLSELTRNEIDLHAGIVTPRLLSTPSTRKVTLDELTDNAVRESGSHDVLRRDCFGQIWRSLGRMTMACAEDGMKPEILEIIAYLHHMEIMPMLIYNQRLSADSTAIQQPPILRLFSSRILTSLSDAAWRAHEKVIVEEAKAKGGNYASLRPEIPGQAYRVRVAGLRPEVWMELILWSCLHGGWVVDGVKILRMLSFEPPTSQWRCLSWRSLEWSEDVNDWEILDHIFNTRSHPGFTDSEPNSAAQIHRTISSEVVNAYVDAIFSVTRLRSGGKGMPLARVIRYLTQMKTLLDRSGLSLSTGSWDAILVRLFDQQPYITEDTRNFKRFVDLSPAMGEELNSGGGRNLPDYVMDPSAAVLGLFHRALQSTVNSGDVGGAFSLFQTLQDHADLNKHHSIADFLKRQQEPQRESNLPVDVFTGYFSGIEYPSFDLQIPPATLASFLDLVTDAKAYEFGHWLVHSRDLDGPVVPERQYGDPALRPVLIRFAAETGDSTLLTRLISTQADLARPGDPAVPESVLQSFFDSQVNLKHWDAAERILQHMEMRVARWRHINLAHVARVMLSEYHTPSVRQADSDFNRAKSLFAEMVSGRYSKFSEKHDDRVRLIVTMVAVLDRYWASFCLDLDCLRGFYDFLLPTKSFNLVLEGIVSSLGSVAGRRVLGIFWPHVVRDVQRTRSSSFNSELEHVPKSLYTPFIGTESRMKQPIAPLRAPFGPTEKRIRSTVRIQGYRDIIVAIYGGVRPDLMTIRIILRQALEEFRNRTPNQNVEGFATSEAELAHEPVDERGLDLSETGMIEWAARCLRSLSMADRDILAELESTLNAQEMQRIRARIPDLFEQV
jgi:hypothetical protein